MQPEITKRCNSGKVIEKDTWKQVEVALVRPLQRIRGVQQAVAALGQHTANGEIRHQCGVLEAQALVVMARVQYAGRMVVWAGDDVRALLLQVRSSGASRVGQQTRYVV